MARTTKTTDETLAAALAALEGKAPQDKSTEEKQREEAAEYVRKTLSDALSDLYVGEYTGEAKDLIARAAANLHSALRNATAAVKKQADPSTLPGVYTQGDVATEGTNAAE